MKALITVIFSVLLLTIAASGNQPVCSASEYAKMDCTTVYIHGKPVQECRWVCVPLSSAGGGR